MNTDELNRLLEKFYDGETTREEELKLERFFSSEPIPAHLQVDRELFLSMKKHDSQIEVPQELSGMLSDLIDRCETEDAQTLSAPKGFSIRFKAFTQQFRFYSAAASILILLGLSLTLFKMNDTRPRDTFSDPMEAYLETQRILSYVSKNMQAGEKAVALYDTNLKKVHQVLEEKRIIE